MRHPGVDRPELPPGYEGDSRKSLLTWEAVEGRLAASRHYWLCTSRPDGRPHVVPRWGVWLDDRFWYDGSPMTRHVLNLEDDSSCVLHLEDGAAATIVEGRSVQSAPIAGGHGERLSTEFGRKYADLGYAPAPTAWSGADAGGLRYLVPSKILAWSEFPTDATRFTFRSDDS